MRKRMVKDIIFRGDGNASFQADFLNHSHLKDLKKIYKKHKENFNLKHLYFEIKEETYLKLSFEILKLYYP